MVDSLAGVGFAVVAAGVAVQSLAVRRGTRTHSVLTVTAVVFIMNVLILLPIAGVVAHPRYEVTFISLGAFAVAGILGSLIARLCYFVGIARIGASRTEPLKALFPVVAVGMDTGASDARMSPRELARDRLTGRTGPQAAGGRRG